MVASDADCPIGYVGITPTLQSMSGGQMDSACAKPTFSFSLASRSRDYRARLRIAESLDITASHDLRFLYRTCAIRFHRPKLPASVERPEAGSFEVNLLRRFGRVSDRSRNCPSTGEPRSRCRSRNRFIAKLLRHVRSAQHGQYGLGNARQCVGGYSCNSRRPLFRLL